MLLPAGSYIQYVYKVKNLHRIHSPFMYSLYEEVIRSKKHYYVFDEIEKRRLDLKSDNRELVSPDPGAGSKGKKSKTVAQIARRSLIHPAWGRMLFKLVLQLKSKKILEMGTSLGVSGAYLAAAAADAELVTIEGRSDISRIAAETFNQLHLKNVIILEGLFENRLKEALERLGKIDLVYLDGDHRGEAVKGYVDQIIPFLSEQGAVIIDDIRWSPSMWQTWSDLLMHPSFEVKADLLRMGLLFKRKGQIPENFVLYPPA
jgi:predicted O-methyltransferase YrrM